MESRFFSHVLSGVTPRTYNNQNNHNHCNNHNINNLAHHLLSVFCAFEAQVPENVIHKMQHLLVEEIKIFYFSGSSSSSHLEKIASLHAGKSWPTRAQCSTLLTLRLLLSKVRPPRPRPWDARLAFQRSRQGKGRRPCQECNRRNTQRLACWT